MIRKNFKNIIKTSATATENGVNMALNFKSAFLFAAIAGISACGYVDSSNPTVNSSQVNTGIIYATFQVTSDESDHVYAHAQLTLERPPSLAQQEQTFVELNGSDDLWLTNGSSVDSTSLSGDFFGDLSQLSESNTQFEPATSSREAFYFIFDRVIINDFGTWYSASMPKTESLDYTVSLLRGSEKTSADESSVTLADAFSVITPLSSQEFSRTQDDMVVEWSNPDPNAHVEIELTLVCRDFARYTYTSPLQTSDTGLYTIPAGTLDADHLGGDCTGTVNIRKITLGEFDTRFYAGSVNGYQIRRSSFVSSE